MSDASSSESKSLPSVPRDAEDDHAPEAVGRRLALCEQVAGCALPHLSGQAVDPGQARGNIENLVGFAQVPVGIAGPLRVQGETGVREVYVPMATTEGALVASYSRGMGWIAASGGARAWVDESGLSQHPILEYADGEQARRAASQALADHASYEEIVGGLTSHGSLHSVIPKVVGRRVILRLVFHTGDAIGVNMAARAAQLIANRLGQDSGATRVHVHGQDVEKRANSRALVEGRGRSAQAEVVVSRELLAEKARTTPEELVAIARTYALGYAHMGTHNWMVQAANGLAAVLLACGQDVAYLTECATGFLDLDLTAEGDLYASVTLPSLLIGTVGGGSGQGTAAECLALLGCSGDGGVGAFGEVLAATVLAGDLSLMAAFTAGEFVAAHEALGRNRPT
ncbi:MAG: 3-hydroxy-3-methylglutaryl-CoA reductase [Planctomycetota bacterium]|jgi:hydroxymethylglutaryl-CoA reductase (NADPH)|nr:3-hydroxy-3-methylglutaryl-CoA reductase [Planctomycetota bacterium]MDP6937975.1 3-hydroxy-3-methylglutaryl-CoA reductase [Planctomycetota bacterium]